LKLHIVAAGKVKEKWQMDAIQEYKKRLSRYCDVEITEVPDAPDTLPKDIALAKEGDKLLASIKDSAFVWVMDLAGDMFNSEAFSKELMKAFDKGGAEIVCVIGGSNGLSPDVIARANQRICLSPMTFTHQMTRVILLEQCYRAFRIERGEPYHK
jgi:23S rRNA (pseudouridine1915-N3)-methyltransferase